MLSDVSGRLHFPQAEVDFDGTYLAAKLMKRYEDEFLGSSDLKKELPVLLAFYAEDVVRTLEREVRDVEREIRCAGSQGMGLTYWTETRMRHDGSSCDVVVVLRSNARSVYPQAQFIELEPASKDATSFAIDGHRWVPWRHHPCST